MRSVPPEPAAPLAGFRSSCATSRDAWTRWSRSCASWRTRPDKRSPEQLARERYALELQAAAALRDREHGMARLAAPAKKAKGQAAAAAPVEAPTGLLATRPALRGFLWGTLTAASLGGARLRGVATGQAARAGGSLTGNVPMAGRGAAPDDEMAAAHGGGRAEPG